MDIHRCRFVPYPPSTINALAFSHTRISKDEKTAPPRLAVGRANGDIEIWNPLRGAWLQETIIRGGKDRSIDGLVWTQDPNEEVNGKIIIGRSRLFSIGYTTTVTEWDLEKGRPLRQASGNHGEIWCISAQPALPQISEGTNGVVTSQWPGQSLIAGCTDGALVLYSTKDEDLQIQRVLVRPSSKKAKIISVTFQDRNIVVAGCTDSTVRIYDIRTGGLLRNMTTGGGPKGGPKEVIIWSVKVLNDGTIISGDSTGELKIWDGQTYTLRQRIKSHKQDILSLATSSDGTAIFSGGMDRRTVTYKPVGKGKPRWAEVGHRRFHMHDVKTMASYEGPGMSVIVSGGPDASPIVIPLGQYGFENQRSLPFLSQEPAVESSPKKRLMLSWWDREVHIWRFQKQEKPSSDIEEDEPATKSKKLVAKILVKGEANITSAALSSDGNLLAVSTIVDIKLFHLRSRKPEESLKVSKISIPHQLTMGARLIEFSPNGKWLCIVHADSHITIVRLLSSSSGITIHPQLLKLTRLDRNIEKSILLGGLGTYDRTITQIAFSSDSRILAISDLSGYIDTFILSGSEDITQPIPFSDAASSSDSSSESDSEDEQNSKSRPKLILGQYWTRNPSASLLPKLPSAPVTVSFRPASPAQKTLTNGTSPHPTRNTPNPIPHDIPRGEDRLLVVTATSEIFELEVLKGGLSAWSRRNPTSAFPEKFRKTLEQVRGVVWDVIERRERVWLYSIGWMWMFDLSKDFENSKPDNGKDVSKKRKRGEEKRSGAGGQVKNSELGMGIGRKMVKYVEDEGAYEELSLVPSSSDIYKMDIDEDDDTSLSQRLIRDTSEPPPTDAKTTSHANETALEFAAIGTIIHEGPRTTFHTFKYRPILGVVVIGEGTPEGGPEVAIVERPIFETDLPPRYYGDQEWKDREVSV